PGQARWRTPPGTVRRGAAPRADQARRDAVGIDTLARAMASDRAPEAPPPLNDGEPESASIDRYKHEAARAAAALVQDGMRVGLGTGSTVAHLLAALGERADELSGARCVATSPATAQIATELGLRVLELDDVGELDIAI